MGVGYLFFIVASSSSGGGVEKVNSSGVPRDKGITNIYFLEKNEDEYKQNKGQAYMNSIWQSLAPLVFVKSAGEFGS